MGIALPFDSDNSQVIQMAKLGSAFMALFLDKKARERVKNRPQQPVNPVQPVVSPTVEEPPLTVQHIHDRLDQAEQEMIKKRSPERLQLIKNALKIRNEQAKLLDELSSEQRQKLQEIAVKSFLK
jgi:hypothetical protein